jgi:hypothetical protein
MVRIPGTEGRKIPLSIDGVNVAGTAAATTAAKIPSSVALVPISPGVIAATTASAPAVPIPTLADPRAMENTVLYIELGEAIEAFHRSKIPAIVQDIAKATGTSESSIECSLAPGSIILKLVLPNQAAQILIMKVKERQLHRVGGLRVIAVSVSPGRIPGVSQCWQGGGQGKEVWELSRVRRPCPSESMSCVIVQHTPRTGANAGNVWYEGRCSATPVWKLKELAERVNDTVILSESPVSLCTNTESENEFLMSYHCDYESCNQFFHCHVVQLSNIEVFVIVCCLCILLVVLALAAYLVYHARRGVPLKQFMEQLRSSRAHSSVHKLYERSEGDSSSKPPPAETYPPRNSAPDMVDMPNSAAAAQKLQRPPSFATPTGTYYQAIARAQAADKLPPQRPPKLPPYNPPPKADAARAHFQSAGAGRPVLRAESYPSSYYVNVGVVEPWKNLAA